MYFNIEYETNASKTTAFEDFEQLISLSPQFLELFKKADEALDTYMGGDLFVSSNNQSMTIEANGITYRQFDVEDFEDMTVAEVAEFVAEQIAHFVEHAEKEYDEANAA